ncbi:right-handed parallel beta-helix repeat-containing protein, partial [Clostridium tagluense]|uniref:right-handed parallel beta-helix repeat-containing protein n=1 Tax=Clostridium tagluense TaxID=360422 RepID=UPI001C6DE41E
MKKNNIVIFILLIIAANIFCNNIILEEVITIGKNTINIPTSSLKVLGSPILDATWTIIDGTTDKANISLNTVINSLIMDGKTKFWIKDGVYNLNGSITINKSNIIIQGESKDNTKIIQTDSGSNSIETRNTNSVQVSELTIDNTIGKIAFLCQSSNKVELKNCIINGSLTNSAITFYGKQCANDIAAVENSDLDDSNIIDGNTVYSYLPDGNVKDGIIFAKQKNGKIRNNTISGSRIAFYLSRNSEVSNNTIADSNTNGIRCTVPAYDNKISNNKIENTKASGITVDRDSKDITTKEYRATGLEISDNTINNSRYFGIEVSNLNGATIKNNKLNKIDFSGIYLLFCDYLAIDSNQIYDCGLSKLNGNLWGWPENTNSGIFADYMVTYSEIHLNEITNSNELNQDCPFGVRIQADETNHDNKVTGNTITDYFEYGTSIRTGNPVNNIDSPNTINLKLKAAPTNIKTVSTLNDIKVSWDAVTRVSEYVIEVDGKAIDNGSITNYAHLGLTSGTNHTYRVRARGGQWSDIVNVSTLAIPVATSIDANDIEVTENQTANVSAVVKDQFNITMNSGFTLNYSIGNTNIADVDGSGKIIAKAYIEGLNTTTLTISVEGTSLTKTINITVKKAIIIPPIPPILVATSIDTNDMEVTENQTANVNALVKDQFNIIINSGYTLKYSIANANIADVDSNGKITAKSYVEGANITTLTISVEGTSLTKTINITVKKAIIIPPILVATSIEASDMEVTENQTANVSAVVKDQFNLTINSGYTLNYSIGNTNIADVDSNGKITAKAYVEGADITTLTISVEGTSLTKTINITVKKAIIIPPIPPILVATSIDTKDIEVTENQTANVSAVVKDQFNIIMNSGYTLNYSIGNGNIADVDSNGKITAKAYVKGADITSLTISVEGTSLTKTINITVKKAIIIPPILVATSIDASDMEVTENQTANVSAVVKDQFNIIINSGYTLNYSIG